MLDDFPVVGLDNRGFPDNSVVCHAHRDTGEPQGTFIEYLDAWRRDSRLWRAWIECLPRGLSVESALQHPGAG